MNPGEPYEFVEVWHVKPDDQRGQMAARGLTRDICDFNDGEPVSDVGRPPAHPNCYCETRVVVRPKGPAGE